MAFIRWSGYRGCSSDRTLALAIASCFSQRAGSCQAGRASFRPGQRAYQPKVEHAFGAPALHAAGYGRTKRLVQGKSPFCEVVWRKPPLRSARCQLMNAVWHIDSSGPKGRAFKGWHQDGLEKSGNRAVPLPVACPRDWLGSTAPDAEAALSAHPCH